ncbi:helix-turn-helix domain-containing protein [Herbaspirillum seropedicae]|uniref:helix-turn-helix domain-containing protein n=1 Tax=Herbaspirillum seropedicae TaxID=964 RepID=UPI002854FDEC|nr:helix-turn-helix domain-containing protein [Herbaspirillum seropedicae]MDR6395202.1 CRP/FNR family transcriptional regulator [Herbaspirillum seropedicae]
MSTSDSTASSNLFPFLTCKSCIVQGRCFPHYLSASEIEQFEHLIGRRRRILRGHFAYRAHEECTKLFIIRMGSFKTVRISPHGDMDIISFHHVGDLLGMGSASRTRYEVDAIALEDSQICETSIGGLASLSRTIPSLQHQVLQRLSEQVTVMQRQSLLLKSKSEQRFATFILDLSRISSRSGHSADDFTLHMSRTDIGLFLGLTNESISRLISRFRKTGLIEVSVRKVHVLAPHALEELASGAVSWNQYEKDQTERICAKAHEIEMGKFFVLDQKTATSNST